MTPLTIIAGFLGSGKTSLLRHIIAHNQGQRLVAIVNDFGALHIDEALIESQTASSVTMANGCVCCSLGDDLARQLATIMVEPPDHILIEASGISDPARIAAFTFLDKELRLNNIVTMIDSLNFLRQLRDPHLVDTLMCQTNAADMFVVSKSDLVDDIAAIENQLKENHPDTPQLVITHGVCEPSLILEPRMGGVMPPPAHAHQHFFSQSWAAAPIARAVLQRTLQSLPLLRAKAILSDDEGAYILHAVGERIEISPTSQAPKGLVVIAAHECDLSPLQALMA